MVVYNEHNALLLVFHLRSLSIYLTLPWFEAESSLLDEFQDFGYI